VSPVPSLKLGSRDNAEYWAPGGCCTAERRLFLLGAQNDLAGAYLIGIAYTGE